MNNLADCPMKSSTKVAGQFPYQAYLSIYPSCKYSKAETDVRTYQQVSEDQLFMSAVIVGIKI